MTAVESGATSEGSHADSSSSSTEAPIGRRLPQQPVEHRRDRGDGLAVCEPERQIRLGAGRQHGLLELRRTALDPVDVERGLAPRAQVELRARLVRRLG